MTEQALNSGEKDHAHAHPSYVTIWAILLGLLVVSVLGPLAEIPLLTLVTAFGIAIVKAYLVVRYFMHLSVEPKYVGFALAAMLGFVLLFFAGTAPDVLRHEGQGWTNVAAQAEVDRVLAATEPTHAPVEEGPFDAAQTFATTCGVCHGEHGGGDGPAAATLDPHPANFTDPAFWATRDRAHVIHVIHDGGASVGRSPLMPGFGSRFTEEQIEAIADHVLSFGPAAAAPADAGAVDAGDAAGEDAGAAAPAPDTAAPAPNTAAPAPETASQPAPAAAPDAPAPAQEAP